MRSNVKLLLAVAIIPAVAGCLPERRIVWSPDGKRAAVMGADALYLCGPDGNLSQPIARGITGAAWLSDSRRLATIGFVEVPRWDDIVPVIGNERAEAVIALAKQMREELLAHTGALDAFEPSVKDEFQAGEFVASLMYLRDHLSAGLAEKLGAHWDELKQATCRVFQVRLMTLDGDKPTQDTLIVRTLSNLVFPYVSPDDRHAAYLEIKTDDFDGTGTLMVVDLEAGASPRMVAEFSTAFPDWSQDGQYLLFARASGAKPTAGNELRLGTISRRKVCGDDGRLLEAFPATEDLAGMLFDMYNQVAGLKDGRIIFSGIEITLPCTKEDMPQQRCLFSVQPGRATTVSRILPRSAAADLAKAMGLFEVSPDETRLAMPDSEGRTIVFSIASATVEAVQRQADPEGKVRTIPTWRSNEELCFALPAQDESAERKAEFVLWTSWVQGTSGHVNAILSQRWPASVVRGVLIPDATTQPDKTPAPAGK